MPFIAIYWPAQEEYTQYSYSHLTVILYGEDWEALCSKTSWCRHTFSYTIKVVVNQTRCWKNFFLFKSIGFDYANVRKKKLECRTIDLQLKRKWFYSFLTLFKMFFFLNKNYNFLMRKRFELPSTISNSIHFSPESHKITN